MGHLGNFASNIDCDAAISMILNEVEKAEEYYERGDQEMAFKELADAHKMIEGLFMDYGTNRNAVHENYHMSIRGRQSSGRGQSINRDMRPSQMGTQSQAGSY